MPDTLTNDLIGVVRLGRTMRSRQRDFFKNRLRGTPAENQVRLEAAREAEKAFDKAAAEIIERAEGRTLL